MKKRTKRNSSKIIVSLTIIIIASYFIYYQNFLPKTLNKNTINNIEESSEEIYKLSLVMVGDALIHDKIYKEALINGNNIDYDFSPMLVNIKDVISAYDLAYYNQETILGGTDLGLSSYPAFNSPYEVGDAFIDAGFNLVSLATNHTLDKGQKAVINSINYWNSKENVLAVGSYNSTSDRNKENILTKNDITYTMLNYTYGTNGIKVPSSKEYLVNIWPVTGVDPSTDISYQHYKETVKNDINNVRDKVDLLLVAMHWGTEYQLSPNLYQKDMASYLASLGVDIVIGTHPHVIQPIEWIGDTLVIYSLGNFISAHEVINIDNRVGLMTSIDITKTIDKDNNITIRLDNLNNELLYTYYTTNYTNIQVIPFNNLTEEYLKGYKNVSSKYVNIVKSIDETINVKIP